MPSDYTGPTTTLANKITLSDSSIDAPGFWSRDTDASSSTGPAAVLAWAGTDASHHLNVMTSSDGFRYGSKITLSDTSPHRPAVTVVQDSGKSVVAIAWMGGNASHSLNVMYDVYHVVNPKPLKIILPISCAYAPTLTSFGGHSGSADWDRRAAYRQRPCHGTNRAHAWDADPAHRNEQFRFADTRHRRDE